MKIWVKTYASLGAIDREMDLEECTSVKDLIIRLKLTPEDVFLILVNGIKASPDTVLKDGDQLSLFPSIGGG